MTCLNERIERGIDVSDASFSDGDDESIRCKYARPGIRAF